MRDGDIIIHPPAGSPPRRMRWWLPVILGTVFLLLGIGMLAWPLGAASWMLSLLVGVALATSGIGFVASGQGGSQALGILLIVFGVLALVFAAFTAQLLVTLLGVLVVSFGVILLMFGLFTRVVGLIFAGILFGLLGGIALVWQEAALTIFAIALGVLSLVGGFWLISLGLRLKRM